METPITIINHCISLDELRDYLNKQFTTLEDMEVRLYVHCLDFALLKRCKIDVTGGHLYFYDKNDTHALNVSIEEKAKEKNLNLSHLVTF